MATQISQWRRYVVFCNSLLILTAELDGSSSGSDSSPLSYIQMNSRVDSTMASKVKMASGLLEHPLPQSKACQNSSIL